MTARVFAVNYSIHVTQFVIFLKHFLNTLFIAIMQNTLTFEYVSYISVCLAPRPLNYLYSCDF